MSLEFVWVYSPSKKIEIEWFKNESNIHGSLIEKPMKHLKSMLGSNDRVFLLSNNEMDLSSNSFFDGNYIYKKEFGTNYTPNNLDEYFSFIYEARGTFSIAYVYANTWNEKVIRFSNDSLGMYPLLYWTNGEDIVVTNNPILSEEVVRKSLKINFERCFTGVSNEIVAFTPLDYGPYTDMKFLPFDSEMLIDNKGQMKIKRRNGDDFFYRAQVDETILFDNAIEELMENITALANAPQNIKIVDITGGFDSRLVLALILKAGVKDRFFFRTNGKYPSPDANVANYIIEKYGLKKIDLSSMPDKRKSYLIDDIIYELSSFVYIASGMKNTIAKHLNTLVTNNNILSVGGGYSAYKANKSKALVGENNLDEAINVICSGTFSLPDKVIDTTQKILKEKIEDWVLSQGMSTYDALDRFHIEYRTRFHIGLCEQWTRVCYPKIHPLQSPALVRLAFKSGYESRITDKLLFQLMERLESSLCLIPFENKAWKKEAYKDSALKNKIDTVKPITLQSKRLCIREPIKEKITSNVDSTIIEKNSESLSNELNSITPSDSAYIKWEAQQRKLGRTWHWYKLGEIKKVFDYLLAQEELQQKEEFAWMKNLGNKKLNEFKSIKDVLV